MIFSNLIDTIQPRRSPALCFIVELLKFIYHITAGIHGKRREYREAKTDYIS